MSSVTHHYETVVIGGGQAGLAMGYYLAQQQRDFVILEAGPRIGEVWRNRWDSLRLFTPAQYDSLPGMPFPAPRNSFPAKDDTAAYLEAYVAGFNLPIQLNSRVEGLTRGDDQYLLEVSGQRLAADQVVLATGPFQRPNIPTSAAELDRTISQLHSSAYRNPDSLPGGATLIVGAGNSGAEIAVELAAAGRRVWLAGRDTGYLPKVLRGEVARWLLRTAFNTGTRPGRRFRESFVKRGAPLITLTAKDIARAGVVRTPRVTGVTDGKPRLADGRLLDVDSVLWATGYRPDFSWISLPILGSDGLPIHEHGVVVGAPGMYVIGLPFQYTFASANLGGVGADAHFIAGHMRLRVTQQSQSQVPAFGGVVG